ncbi:hypothetical protein AHAS_Ahas05G0096200 [Arachis hypogaea]
MSLDQMPFLRLQLLYQHLQSDSQQHEQSLPLFLDPRLKKFYLIPKRNPNTMKKSNIPKGNFNSFLAKQTKTTWEKKFTFTIMQIEDPQVCETIGNDVEVGGKP